MNWRYGKELWKNELQYAFFGEIDTRVLKATESVSETCVFMAHREERVRTPTKGAERFLKQVILERDNDNDIRGVCRPLDHF